MKTAHLWKRGRNYYIVYQSFRSMQIKLSVGSDFRAASKLLVRVNEMLMERKDPKQFITQEAIPVEPMTLKMFFPVFMERHGRLQSVKTQQVYYERMHQIGTSNLDTVPMYAVTKAMVYDYMTHRSSHDHVSAATVNKELSVLKVMYAKALEWEMISVNPIHEVRKYKEAPKRMVFLTRDQAQALIEKLPRTLGYIVEFAIYTGLRKENILSLTIDQVDLQRCTVTLGIKGGRVEVFPLSDLAVDVLRQIIGKREHGLVFPSPDGVKYHRTLCSFTRAVDELELKVGEGRFHFHDLRHVFGSWLAEAGVSLDSIRLLMGHRVRSTTDRYVTVRNSTIADLSNRIPRIRKEKD
jgi:integrase